MLQMSSPSPCRWNAIQSAFQPIRGVDMATTPHPVPAMHKRWVQSAAAGPIPSLISARKKLIGPCDVAVKRRGLRLGGFTGKVYALALSHFRHVLMIDADNVPLQVRGEGDE